MPAEVDLEDMFQFRAFGDSFRRQLRDVGMWKGLQRDQHPGS